MLHHTCMPMWRGCSCKWHPCSSASCTVLQSHGQQAPAENCCGRLQQAATRCPFSSLSAVSPFLASRLATIRWALCGSRRLNTAHVCFAHGAYAAAQCLPNFGHAAGRQALGSGWPGMNLPQNVLHPSPLPKSLIAIAGGQLRHVRQSLPADRPRGRRRRVFGLQACRRSGATRVSCPTESLTPKRAAVPA